MGPGALIHEHEQLQYLNMFIIIKWIIWLTDRGSMAAWHNPESLILRIASDGNGPLGLNRERTHFGSLCKPKFCTNIFDYTDEWDTFEYPTPPQQDSRAECCPRFFRNDELCLTGNGEWMRKTVSQPKVWQCSEWSRTIRQKRRGRWPKGRLAYFELHSLPPPRFCLQSNKYKYK